VSATVLLTALTGTVAGYLFHRWRLPGGAMVGAILAVGTLHVSVPMLEPVARDARIVAQIMIGIVIGASIRKEPLLLLRRYIPHIALVLVVVLGAAVASGLLLAAHAGFDLLTALLATVPGGSADVTAAALDLNSDVAIVAAFQLVRQLTIFLVIALFFGKALGRGDVPPAED
jgi:uncharacterized protein